MPGMSLLVIDFRSASKATSVAMGGHTVAKNALDK